MKKIRSIFLLAGRTVFVIGILNGIAFGQEYNKIEQNAYSSQIFTEAFAFKSDSAGKGRLDVYVQVPYYKINFVKDDKQYVGRIEISVSVQTDEKQEVWQMSRTGEIRLEDFTQTASHRLSSIKRFTTDLLPGKYDVAVQVKDNESKNIAAINKSVKIKDFGTDTLALSDLMLAHRVDLTGTQRSIVPNLTGTITKDLGSLYLFFEVYNKTPVDSVQLSCTFINKKKEPVAQRTRTEFLSGGRVQITWKIDTPSLPADLYVIFIKAAAFPKTGSPEIVYASSSRTCLVRIKDFPLTVTDVEKAAEQLQYFARESEIDFIREAPTEEERERRFFEFWAKRDPDPGTPQNELMEEYYSRVAYANSTFSQYNEGWRTDRGMIFIRFGPPQSIDRQPFNTNSKPYEIWYYYNHNRKFLFIDETGFGDYRLYYLGSSLWERIN
ncbi:MAG: GWxTD domain-containing protein [Bacteroidetes bacterium]|nr:GWxTD domain-containing protein [Bacteroidota bacterium]